MWTRLVPAHTQTGCATQFFFGEKTPDVNPAVNLPPSQETENDA